jgi:NADH-quinone oxidoreductase subunit L
MQDAAALTPSVEFNLLWLIPALPLLGAAVNGLFGLHLSRRFGPRINHRIAIALPTVSFVVATIGFFLLRHQIQLHETSHGSDGALALSQNLFPFIHVGLLDADLAFWLDPLSAVMALVVTGIGTLIHVYSIGYMAGDDGYWRFFAYLNLFMAAMLTLVLGDNFLVMFIGWEGVGLCSYLLISFWYRNKANATAGNKAFIVNRVGDFGFVLGMALLFWGLMGNHTGSMFVGADHRGAATFATDGYRTGYYGAHRITDLERDELCAQYGGSPDFCTFASLGDEPGAVPARGSLAERFRPARQAPPTSLRFDAVRARVHQDHPLWAENSASAKTFMGAPIILLICLLLFVGATGKSAQIPLYVWLPDAMAGPTPVSALIHAATMVTAGVYMVARCSFLFSISPTAMTVVAVVGAFTALFAATIGLFQYDIKKVLAYSTVSQLGYMFIGVGVGAYWAGIYHLVTHAAFKACLFLGSGSVILGCHHEQDMRKMGGLKRFMPSTERTYLLSCIAITTAPVFVISNGFFSKDEILWKAFDAAHILGGNGWVIWLVGFLGAGLTAFYMWRSYYMTFTGEYRGGHSDDDHHGHGGDPHESPRTMTWVLWTLVGLSFFTILLGFWPLLGGLIHSHALQEPLLERWLHPVLGAATAGLDWLSHTKDMHTTELLLALASVVISLGGWWTARLLYKDGRSPVPQRLLESKAGLVRKPHTLIYNKYFVDELYGWAFVRGLGIAGSRTLFWFDQKIIDGLVNLAGFMGRVVAAIDGLIDALVVDGMVNGVASIIGGAGSRIRKMQTGRIQTYLAGAIVGALLLVAANYLLAS